MQAGKTGRVEFALAGLGFIVFHLRFLFGVSVLHNGFKQLIKDGIYESDT